MAGRSAEQLGLEGTVGRGLTGARGVVRTRAGEAKEAEGACVEVAGHLSEMS